MDSHVKLFRRIANSIARKNGFGRATKVIRCGVSGFVDGRKCGYRKFTTGEYVSNAYRAKFGWKNTYYQHSECTVSIA